MAIDVKRTVGDLVAERISRAAVLDGFKLDYCCHGRTPLEEACRTRGVDLAAVVAAVEADDAAPRDKADVDYANMPLGELADHIVSTHHSYLRRELPRVGMLLDRVVAAHADRHPELHDVARTYAALSDGLASHQIHEEETIFPRIRGLETATRAAAGDDGVHEPIHTLMHEHDAAGAAIEKIRDLTGGYATPADGCATYEALMAGFEALQTDLHRHVHKENNILFPKAVALEASLA